MKFIEMILKFQSSIHPGHFKKVEKIRDFLKISKVSKKWEKESGRGSCPSSFPSGNQVDGSPLVAIKGAPCARAQILISGHPLGLKFSSFRTEHIPRFPGRSKQTKPKYLEWQHGSAVNRQPGSRARTRRAGAQPFSSSEPSQEASTESIGDPAYARKKAASAITTQCAEHQ